MPGLEIFGIGGLEIFGGRHAVPQTFLDDVPLEFGTDSDIVELLRSATLTANTALTGVLIGTPVTPALAADSLIISNVTANGDILIAGNDGGNSRSFFFADVSTGVLNLCKIGTPGSATAAGDVYTAGALEIDGIFYAGSDIQCTSNIKFANGTGVYPTVNTDAQAYHFNSRDVDGSAWIPMISFTSANDPTLDICPSGGHLGFFGATAVGQQVDARIDDAINSGDATTDGVIDAMRDALITYGLIAAA